MIQAGVLILVIAVTVPLTVYYTVKLGVVGYYSGKRLARKLEEQSW